MFAVMRILALHTTGKGLGVGKVERRRSSLLFSTSPPSPPPAPPRKVNHGLTSAVVLAWKIKNESPVKAMTAIPRPLPSSTGKTIGCQLLNLLIAQAGGVIVWGGFTITL